MNIVYATDNSFVPVVSVSLISLLHNNHTVEELEVFILCDSVAAENISTLKNICDGYNRKISFIDISCVSIPDCVKTKRWPNIAFARLYLGSLLPQNISKIIYIDCDTVVVDSLIGLWQNPMDGMFIAAVLDCVGNRYRTNIGLRKGSTYINTGLLVIDLSLLRQIDMRQEILSFFSDKRVHFHYPDQDFINVLFKNKIKVLTPRYNVFSLMYELRYNQLKIYRRPGLYYTEAELQSAKLNPCIIHYTSSIFSIRPWYSNSKHPVKNYFDKYASLSPWFSSFSKAYIPKGRRKVSDLVIRICPRGITIILLGLIHCFFYPLFIRILPRKQPS